MLPLFAIRLSEFDIRGRYLDKMEFLVLKTKQESPTFEILARFGSCGSHLDRLAFTIFYNVSSERELCFAFFEPLPSLGFGVPIPGWLLLAHTAVLAFLGVFG